MLFRSANLVGMARPTTREGRRNRSRARTATGYTAISLNTGIGIPYISRIMTGHRDPRLSTLRRMAKGMKVPISEVIDLIEERRRVGVPAEVSRRIVDGMRAAAKRRVA